ncbi:MAG TPA: ATP-binding protein [Candidatus Obscuribacterales bacterium]
MAPPIPLNETRLSLFRKGLLLLAVPLILQICFLTAMGLLLKEAEQEIDRERQTRETFARATELSNAIQEATVALGVYSTNRSPMQSNEYNASLEKSHELLGELKQLLHTQDQQIAKNIESQANNALTALQNARQGIDDERRDIGQFRMRQLLKEIRSFSAQFGESLGQLEAKEQELEKTGRRTTEETRNALQSTLFAGTAISVIITIAMALVFFQRITRRLAIITDNSLKLAAGQPLNPRMEGEDEISHLDSVFHEMCAAISEAQAKERAIIENSADVICSIGADGKFTAVSASSERLWGFEPHELLGRNFSALIDEHSRAATNAAIESAVASKSAQLIENQLIRKDGSRVDMAWSVAWVDKEHSLFCVVRDISDKKKLEELKQEFMAMVSHDLRTPLSSLRFFLSLLGEGSFEGLPPDVVANARDAEGEVARLIQLVNSLLEVAKMESGQLNVSLKPTAMASVIERSVAAVKGVAMSQDVNLSVPETDTCVLGDEDRLVQVMVNLMSNAVQFSPAGSCISIHVDNMGDWVRLRVCDQGPGIGKEDQTRIFDRFEQGNLSNARIKGGAGLGLAICKAIVDEHKGTIGVESKEGKGSMFWVKLPAATPQDALHGSAKV